MKKSENKRVSDLDRSSDVSFEPPDSAGTRTDTSLPEDETLRQQHAAWNHSMDLNDEQRIVLEQHRQWIVTKD